MKLIWVCAGVADKASMNGGMKNRFSMEVKFLDLVVRVFVVWSYGAIQRRGVW